MLRRIHLSAILVSSSLLAQTHNALDFDGVDDRVNCGAASAVDITGTGITLEAWIYPTAWKPQVFEGTIISKDGGILSFAGYMLRAGGNGEMDFAYGTGSAWTAIASPENALTLNTWQHVAGTYDGLYTRLYVNGALVATGTASTVITSTPSELVLGDWSTATGRNFPGAIDEVRIWDIALDGATIANMQNASYCGDEAGLVAYYRFDQGVGGGNNTAITMLDDLMDNAEGTLSGFALTGTTSNFIGGTIPGTPVSDGICAGGAYLYHGVTYTDPGTYTVTIPNGACDSTVILTLTEVTVNTTVSQNVNILMAQAAGASYQWIDCVTDQPIAGATSQSYMAFAVGEYAVIVTQNGCADTSACYVVTTIGMEELELPALRIWPQPASDLLNVELSYALAKAELSVTDLSGRVVLQHALPSLQRTTLDVSTLASGAYHLELRAGDQRRTVRFVRE